MSVSTPLVIMALMVALLLATVNAPALATSAHQQPVLQFVGASGPDRSSVQVDLGDVDPIPQPTLTQEFRLRNASSSAVRIGRLQGSCGCTSLLLDGHAVEDKPIEVAAGAEVSLQAIHDLSLVHPGQLTKYLWVYLEGEKKPAATVEIKLKLRPCVRFIPSSLVFGKVPAGASRSLRVTAEIDDRIVKAVGQTNFPPLGSSDPDVTVTQLSTANSSSSTEFCTCTYRVTLSPKATLGVHYVTLSYPPSTGGGAVPDPKGLILAQVSLGAQAVVEGRISVTPAIALFGEVDSGKEHRLRLDLAGKDAAALRGLSVLAGSPWLSARVLPLVNPGRAILEVRVAADAPFGSHQAQVILRTADRQRLVVPVTVAIPPINRPPPSPGSP